VERRRAVLRVVGEDVERAEEHAHERGLRGARTGGLDEVVLPPVVAPAAEREIDEAQEQEPEERGDNRDVRTEAELEDHVRVRHAHDHGDDQTGEDRLPRDVTAQLAERDRVRTRGRRASAAERLQLVLLELCLGDLDVGLFVTHAPGITRVVGVIPSRPMTVNLVLGSAQARLEGPNARMFAGRDPTACQLAHQDATLSRRHAELWIAGDGTAYIRDLGSANGTWVDGKALGADPVALRPGQQVWLGHVQLGVTLPVQGGQTVMAQTVPPELQALIAARQQQTAAAPPPATSTSTPLPADFAYRKQGSNDNGVLLLALKQDTHWCGGSIDGYVEFTATDNENVASITVELVEVHRRGSAKGHVWDRVLVRQGPWKAMNGDILPLPFALRVPAGTSMTSKDVSWELRGLVDINWASDIEASIPITMRNQDIERLRDGMGAMDYRVEDVASVPGGQRFEGKFAPPAQLARDMGVNSVALEIEYLGANLKVRMKLDRKGMHHDPALDQVFELARLRTASQPEVNATLRSMLDALLPK